MPPWWCSGPWCSSSSGVPTSWPPFSAEPPPQVAGRPSLLAPPIWLWSSFLHLGRVSYMNPSSTRGHDKDKPFFLLYIIITPRCDPIMYSFKTRKWRRPWWGPLGGPAWPRQSLSSWKTPGGEAPSSVLTGGWLSTAEVFQERTFIASFLLESGLGDPIDDLFFLSFSYCCSSTVVCIRWDLINTQVHLIPFHFICIMLKPAIPSLCFADIYLTFFSFNLITSVCFSFSHSNLLSWIFPHLPCSYMRKNRGRSKKKRIREQDGD